MKNRITVAIRSSALAFVVAILVGGCASAPKANVQPDFPEERAQIQRRLNEIFDAAAKKDLDRLESYHFYGPKFSKFSASSPSRQGASAARKGERDGLAAISGLKMQPEDLKIDVFGDVGIATFVLDSSFKVGADTIERQERSTLVFVKEHGAWKIAHEHFSPMQSNP